MLTPHPWKGIRPWERHSLVLLVAGLMYILIGVSYITVPLTDGRAETLHVALDWWNIEVWGGIFIFAGLLAVVSSRWPPVSETWGYTVLTGLSTGWGMFYLMADILDYASAAAFSGFLVWSLLGFMWWAISGLTNPASIEVVIVEGSEDGRDERS